MIRLDNITKIFPGVRALDRVSLEAHPGEVHALCGENGAGKSTLMKVLAGVYPHSEYEGKILLDGVETRFQGVSDAAKAGIAIVHQELALMPEMTVLDNLFLGRERSGWGILKQVEQRRIARDHFASLDFDAPLDALVGELGIGLQQRLEIARALLDGPEVLVLDEPTSALPEDDAEQLLSWIRKLADAGTTCIYISHRMEEVFQLADRITVLRDGQSIWTRPTDEIGPGDVIEAMVGREQGNIYDHNPLEPGAILCKINDVRVSKGRRVLLEVDDLVVREGEIVGLAGLMGAGRTCLLRTLTGSLDNCRVEGRFEGPGFENAALPSSPADAIRRGLCLIPEDRKTQALFLDEDLIVNITQATVPTYKRFGFLDRRAMRECALEKMEQFAVKAPGPDVWAKTLSGGNQQKVLLGRAAEVAPRLLLLDEPTRGIDIGAKEAIYQRMEAWTREGVGILWSSSELVELLGVSDRIYVLAGGKITAHFQDRPFEQAQIMARATE